MVAFDAQNITERGRVAHSRRSLRDPVSFPIFYFNSYTTVVAQVQDKDLRSPPNSYIFVSHAAHLLTSALSRVFNYITQGTSKTWPTNMSSLMPDGPHQAVQSLLQWRIV
ncbi:hypothetical protein BJ165DRAFT_1467225 [Panaeolus papilionaceus]|nr:hypothetical protein BJ165DRAFT_1467225 [Panaeolus papilionaceus]